MCHSEGRGMLLENGWMIRVHGDRLIGKYPSGFYPPTSKSFSHLTLHPLLLFFFDARLHTNDSTWNCRQHWPSTIQELHFKRSTATHCETTTFLLSTRYEWNEASLLWKRWHQICSMLVRCWKPWESERCITRRPCNSCKHLPYASYSPPVILTCQGRYQ